MTRKFNFRIWHKPTKYFLNPWSGKEPVLNLKVNSDSKWGVGVAIYDRGTESWSFLADDDIVIQQSTGEFDKNGREIYEGDLVFNYDTTQEVRWIKAYSGYQFCLCNKDGETDFYGGLTAYPDNLEVIGHINA